MGLTRLSEEKCTYKYSALRCVATGESDFHCRCDFHFGVAALTAANCRCVHLPRNTYEPKSASINPASRWRTLQNFYTNKKEERSRPRCIDYAYHGDHGSSRTSGLFPVVRSVVSTSRSKIPIDDAHRPSTKLDIDQRCWHYRQLQ